MSRSHREIHRSDRAGWLRAAVLGSDDAIVSTASLMIGVAASSASKEAILVAGVAGLVAGSMSMAVGEYVSVSSQRDAERADIEREKGELATQPQDELNELAMIYANRGLDQELAMTVAKQLSAHDRLGTHMRDELGIDQTTRASDASGVDIGRELCLLRPASDCGSARRADGLTHPRDRRAVSRESRGSRCVWRSSRRRAARSCRVASHHRRGPGDGGDRRHRAALRCCRRLKSVQTVQRILTIDTGSSSLLATGPISSCSRNRAWGSSPESPRGGAWPDLARTAARRLAGAVAEADEKTLVPLVGAPADFLVIAAGGRAGVQSAFIPGWGGKNGSQSVSREIRKP